MREMELAVLDWIQAYMRCGALDVLMPFISRLSDHGEIWILTAAALLLSRRWRNQGKTLACGLVLDLAACSLSWYCLSIRQETPLFRQAIPPRPLLPSLR